MTSLNYNGYTLNIPRRPVSLKLTPMNSDKFLSYLQYSSRISIMDISIDLDTCYCTHRPSYIFKLYNFDVSQEITLEHVDYYAAFFCLYLCYGQDKIKKYSIEQINEFLNTSFIFNIFDLFGKQFIQFINDYPEYVSIVKLIPEKFKQEYNKIPEFKKVLLKHYSDIYGDE